MPDPVNFKMPGPDAMRQAVNTNNSLGCSTYRWRVGEIDGNSIFITITNDPDEIEGVEHD